MCKCLFFFLSVGGKYLISVSGNMYLHVKFLFLIPCNNARAVCARLPPHSRPLRASVQNSAGTAEHLWGWWLYTGQCEEQLIYWVWSVEVSL